MHIFRLNTLWRLEKCSWKSAKLDDTGKSRPNVFSLKFCFFVKLVNPRKSYVLQKVTEKLHSFCVKENWSPRVNSGYSQTRCTRKYRRYISFLWSFARFSKTSVFNKVLRDTENIWKPAEHLIEVFLSLKKCYWRGLSCSKIRETVDKNRFFHG